MLIMLSCAHYVGRNSYVDNSDVAPQQCASLPCVVCSTYAARCILEELCQLADQNLWCATGRRI